jgi:hypothetical protein
MTDVADAVIVGLVIPTSISRIFMPHSPGGG